MPLKFQEAEKYFHQMMLQCDSEPTSILCNADHIIANISEDKMPLAKDLLHPLPAEEKRKHKLKRLVQHPNSYFMDVKCPGCYRYVVREKTLR